MGTTLLPIISQEQFAQRIARGLPTGWAGQDALTGGLAHDFLFALGGQFAEVLNTLQYVLEAARLETETSPELDEASVDYLGDTLPRPSGMGDAAYAQLIIANILKTAVTRPAIQSALTFLTGVQPRMMEPWNIFDTGTWGRTSYWDVDTAPNPARWASSDRWQGFIETVFPAIPAIGANNPILCWGDSAYWNVPGYFFGIITTQSGQSVFDLVNRLRAWGITVWVKLLTVAAPGTNVPPSAPTALTLSVPNPTSIVVTWTASATGTTPINYLVQYRQRGTPLWTAATTQPNTSFTITGLQPGTFYDAQVTAQNTVGSSTSDISTIATPKVPPSPALALQATQVQATAITLTWSPPTTGTPPFAYTVQYRVSGTQIFSAFPVGAGTIGVTVIGLQPSTKYDFDVVTSNL